MPLLLPVLTKGLVELPTNAPPSDVAGAANRWFDVWWGYAKDMTYLNPLLVNAPGADTPVRAVFLPLMVPAMALPSPTPVVFFKALEASMLAAWAVLASPLYAVPPYGMLLPPPLFIPPLLPTLSDNLTAAVPPVGFASLTPEPPMALMATWIDTWTRLFQAAPAPGATAPPVPFV